MFKKDQIVLMIYSLLVENKKYYLDFFIQTAVIHPIYHRITLSLTEIDGLMPFL